MISWKAMIASVAAVPMVLAGMVLGPLSATAQEEATPVTQQMPTSGSLQGTAIEQVSNTGPKSAATQGNGKPIADFDFNSAPVDGVFNGGSAIAAVQGTANLVTGQSGSNTAAQLGSGFWMNVTKNDGTSLLAGLDDITISYDSMTKQTGAGWTLFAATNAGQVNGNAPTYLGVLDHTNKTRIERYLNGRGGDAATIDANAGTGANWKHIDVVISGTSAKLYVNKKFVASNGNGNTLGKILGGSGGVLQIGKGNWGTGEYFNGLLDNLKIYDTALSATDLGIEQPTAVVITGSHVENGTLQLAEGSTASLKASVTPVGAEPTVTWESDNPAVATVDGNGQLTAIKAGTATISAKSFDNPMVAGSITISVVSVGADDPYGYVMVHFIENSSGYAEKIYLDISRGDNPEQWDPLNGGEPIVTNNESSTGVRDPFIAYNPELKTYYVLATDLRVFGGDNAGWGTWSNQYSTKLHVWETKDFIHFSDMKSFDTSADTSGRMLTSFTDQVNGNTISDLGMAWAPEATWVSDFYDLNDDGVDNGSASGGSFVVYWAANPTINGTNRHNRVMWGYTDDFSQRTFHLGGVFVDTGGNTIDTTMLQKRIGISDKAQDGTNILRSYRMSKDNGTGQGIFMQTTDRQDWWKASDWKTTQTSIGSPAWTSSAGGVEGPAGFKDHNSDIWYLYVDVIPSTGYRPMVSTDLDGSTPWAKLDTSGFYMAPSTKHGGIVSLTKSQYDEIRDADANASGNADLQAGTVSVDKDATVEQINAALPKTQQITLANSYGTAIRNVTWDVSGLDVTREGTYTVTGIVDTIGANKNHWKWTNSSGESKTDEDNLINSGADANNSWKQSGGFTDDETANKNRQLYSSTAITVSAQVQVGDAQTNPTDPDPLADFTFEGAGDTFTGGNAVGEIKGVAKRGDSKDGNGKAAKLGKDFWLNVTAKDGSSLLKGRNDITISYDAKPDGNNNTGWSFFAASDASKQEYGQEHYVGVLDKTTGVTVERYDNDGKRDSSGNVSYSKTNAAWKHVDIVIADNITKLYVDSKLVAVNRVGRSLTDILGSDGGVLQIGKANWSDGEYFSGLLDNLKIWGRVLSDDELGVEGAKTDYAAALAIPARITGDLPSEVLGRHITWKASGEGANNVDASGKVTRPASGEAAMKVTLTAIIDGVAPIEAEAEILNIGGTVASYTKDVDRSNPEGDKYDPLAYKDDRRVDSLYVAARTPSGEQWETLNRSHSILSVKWDGSQSAKPNAQMGSPTFFRDKSGRLGALASQNNATGAIYLWDGTGNGATFTNQRLISISDSSIVSNPRLIYDAATHGYKVFWTDALNGQRCTATLSDLTVNAVAGQTYKADGPETVADEVDGLPAWADEGQTSTFAMDADEYRLFTDYYVELRNTGVKSIAPVDVKNDETTDDIKKALAGSKATMTYNDGSEKTLNVTWDADDIAAIDSSKAGVYDVNGTVDQTAESMVNDARADPDIFYNEDDGYYYLTGSTYEVQSTAATNKQSDSYRSIGLKRSKTINGLKDAKESIIIKPENGTPGHQDQYPDSFYGWSAFIWAQEFHKINGKWWIVAGFHRGASTANGNWCNNTVLIPYTGDTQSIKDGGFLKAKNWGEPTVLEGAAFDVTYFQREENGNIQGYWLQPKNANLYVAKAKMGEGTVPLAAGDFKQIYKISQIFDYGKQAPTPDDDVEGSDQGVVEAPFMFEHGEYIYIAYSGGTVDKYYTTNLMRASKNADLQSEASWTQIDFSVFDTNDTYTGIYGADESSYERRQAGPGHISLVHDEAGNIALAYHARPYPEIHSGSAAGGLMDQDRNTWIKAINVRANGMLDMSVTKDQEVAPQNRTVTIRVKVAESDETTAPSVSSIAVRKLPNTIDYTVDEQFSDRGLVIEATMSDGTKKTLQSNEYILDEVDTSKPGTRRVTVMLASDSSISTSFTITVTEKTANPQPVDKTALKAEIAKAGGLQESDYTSRSWQTYCLALQNARHVLADTGATQTQVDQALKDLRNAKLVRKDSVNQSTPNSSSGLANTGTATGIMMLVAIVLAGAGVTLLRRRN